uniref:Uncharacterized protein n=1 Tax=Knipowitschia caucasica TaxID=637954 RepID=A0AAV2JBG8_KNICA
MAAERAGCDPQDPQDMIQEPEFDPEFDELHGGAVPKRHARVTVKYNRKELQKRLDVEKWIDESLDQLYSGQPHQLTLEKEVKKVMFSYLQNFHRHQLTYRLK